LKVNGNGKLNVNGIGKAEAEANPNRHVVGSMDGKPNRHGRVNAATTPSRTRSIPPSCRERRFAAPYGAGRTVMVCPS